MNMGEKPAKPTVTLPPRSSMESLFAGGTVTGFSPGPMTLVSNFFSDNNNINCTSFSQLLAGAMTSPVSIPTTTTRSDPVEESGFRQNRPGNLVLSAQNQTVLPELSPFGFLSPSFFSPLQSPFGMSHQQALAQVTAQAAFSQSYMQMQQPEQQPEQQQQPYFDPVPHHQPIAATQQFDTVSVMSEPESFAMESPEVTQSERKTVPLSIADKPANDGYNWRKYGQKQVKASEYPRSYYKCTYQNCRVTKKVERNLEGKITEIIYKNQHNHDLPELSRRTKNNIDTRPNVSSEIGLPRENEVSRSIEVPHVSHEREQSLPQLTSVPPSNSNNGLAILEVEPRAIEDNEEPYPKRRNIEVVEQSEKPSFAKTVTEPKIVLQTRSEVDLLIDGYKWRKYGQKVVKGNPHPRSYYKCTYNGCNVRKHVERSSTDPKAVITTYEGKHNHDVPAPRKSNHSAPEIKPQKPVARKRVPNQEMEFNHDQRHLLLQLKEEHIRV